MTGENEPISKDARAAEVAAHLLAAALLQDETPKQRQNTLTDIEEVLLGAGVDDVEVKSKKWHEREHEAALKIEELFRLDREGGEQLIGILPKRISANTKAEIFDLLLGHDEIVSKLTGDERTIAEKGVKHYRDLFKRYTQANFAPKRPR